LVDDMIDSYLKLMKKHKLLEEKGYNVIKQYE
jgi:hypothetical protein